MASATRGSWIRPAFDDLSWVCSPAFVIVNDVTGELEQQLFRISPHLHPGEQQATFVNGDLALNATRLVGGAVTAEVARRQPDGTWLWAIDQPNTLG